MIAPLPCRRLAAAALLGLLVCGAAGCAASPATGGATAGQGAPARQALLGRWALATVNGSAPGRGSTLILSFTEDGQVTGNIACNSYSGRYAVEGNRLRLLDGSMTLVGCGGMDTATVDRLAEAMQSEATFAVSDDTLTVRSRGMTGVFRRP